MMDGTFVAANSSTAQASHVSLLGGIEAACMVYGLLSVCASYAHRWPHEFVLTPVTLHACSGTQVDLVKAKDSTSSALAL